jgi:hypothetical protein
MNETETASKDAVYCNHCGTQNPPRSVICCGCGHVHAITRDVPESHDEAISVEQWVWNLLAIGCGVVVCLAHALPTSGALSKAALLGSICGSLAIPVVIGVLVGKGSWAKSSRWFLNAAVALALMRYLGELFGKIHSR